MIKSFKEVLGINFFVGPLGWREALRAVPGLYGDGAVEVPPRAREGLTLLLDEFLRGDTPLADETTQRREVRRELDEAASVFELEAASTAVGRGA